MRLFNLQGLLKNASSWERLEGAFFMYALGIVSAECTSGTKPYDNIWLEVFLWVYLFAAVIIMLPKWPCRIVKGIVYFVAYTVSIADVFCLVKFDSTINPSILMLMGETDTREAGEFFSAYLSPDILFSNVGWILLVLLLHLLWSIHRWTKKPTKLIACEQRTEAFLAKKYSFFIFHFSFFILFFVSIFYSYTNISQLYTLMTEPTIGDVEHKLTEKDRGNQFLPLYRFAFSVYANHLAAKQIDVLHEVEKTVRVDSCSYTSPNIVLIIGEAYNKHHSQLYGYDRSTTPRQLQLAKAGKLIPFTDVVSPWNLTSFVFKHIMSTYTVGDKGDWCDYPLFGEIFRKAGYHVTFLTNEFLYQAKQQVFDFSGGFFLNDPQLSAAQFDSRNEKLHIFDEGLLDDYKNLPLPLQRRGDAKHINSKTSNPDGSVTPPLEGLRVGELCSGMGLRVGELRSGMGQGQVLTIFHLIGQHQDYRIRCPKSKQHFKIEDYADRTDLTNKKWKQNLCNYDNATLYNDSIVTEIINLFKDQDAIVIYMPDHGEEVHSRELPHFSGRMHSTTITKRLAREEFEIPFWIYATPKYRSRRPAIWQEVKAAASRPYMTDALPHLLMYLAGIHCKYYRPDLNILSPRYNAKRPRILKHQVDYDIIMKNKE